MLYFKSLGLTALLFVYSCGLDISTYEKKIQEAIDITDPVQGIKFAKPIRLSQNSTAFQSVCAKENQITLDIDGAYNGHLFCSDRTSLRSGLVAGQLSCVGGVTYQSVNSSQAEVPCSEAKICGKSATQITTSINEIGSATTRLVFNDLPWGCSGELKYRSTQNLSIGSSLSILVNSPACHFCTHNQSYFCSGGCVSDTTPPVINSLELESLGCGKLKLTITATDAGSGLHEKAYSFDGGITYQESPIHEIVVSSGTSYTWSAGQARVRDSFGNVNTTAPSRTSTFTSCPCVTPWGTEISHNGSVVAYSHDVLRCTLTCNDHKITRLCQNGVLQGSDEFYLPNCVTEVCETGGGVPLECKDPITGRNQHPFLTMPFYNKECVNDGETCDQNRVFRFCNPLTGSFELPRNTVFENVSSMLDQSQYRYSSCKKCSDIGKKISIDPSDKLLTPLEFSSALLCRQSENVASCLFYKNPARAAIRGGVNPSTLTTPIIYDSHMKVGTKLRSATVDNNSALPGLMLVNDSFTTYSSSNGTVVDGAPLVYSPIQLKTSISHLWRGNSVSKITSQINLFYAANLLSDRVTQVTGSFAAGDRNIALISIQGGNVFANAYWSFGSRQVVMGFLKPPGATHLFVDSLLSHSSEIVHHELGHANFAFAANGNIYGIVNQANCGLGLNQVCCNSKIGCIRAIDEGQADFHVMFTYPSFPQIGEDFTKSEFGLTACGLSRDPSSHATLTFEQAYLACGNNSHGQIHAMGVVYNALWYQVYVQAQAESAGRGDEILKLFINHLKVLSSTDTFISAINIAIGIDEALNSGRNVNLFEAQLLARDPP